MLHHSLRANTWATVLAAITAFALTDPPASGERALLGWTPMREAGSSNLRMARPAGRVSASRALLGQLTTSEEQVPAAEEIQIRARGADGPGALLGQQ